MERRLGSVGEYFRVVIICAVAAGDLRNGLRRRKGRIDVLRRDSCVEMIWRISCASDQEKNICRGAAGLVVVLASRSAAVPPCRWWPVDAVCKIRHWNGGALS